jgi:hypothetical protein
MKFDCIEKNAPKNDTVSYDLEKLGRFEVGARRRIGDAREIAVDRTKYWPCLLTGEMPPSTTVSGIRDCGV